MECHDTTTTEIKNILEITPNVNSLSITELKDDIEVLGPQFIPKGACVKHFQISQTNIKDIVDDSFTQLQMCLETLKVVESKVKLIPYKALSGLSKLISVDLTSNDIAEIPSYSFYGLPIVKLNLKGNKIRDISETAFSSLQTTRSRRISFNFNRETI